jgi:8-oxo-dGTP diphosphatase
MTLSSLISEGFNLLDAVAWRAAAVAVERDGKVLMLRRGATAPWMPGKWNLPGGTVDPGENEKQTAAREAEEEVGIVVSNLKLLRKEYAAGGVVHVFHTTTFKGEPKAGWENPILRWVPKEKVAALDLVPGIRKALQSL